MKREIEPVSIRSIPSKQLAHAITYVTVDTIFRIFSPVLLLLHHHLYIVKWMREKGSQWMNKNEKQNVQYNEWKWNRLVWIAWAAPTGKPNQNKQTEPNLTKKKKSYCRKNDVNGRTRRKICADWIACAVKFRNCVQFMWHCCRRKCCRIIKCITKFYGMQKSDERRRSSLREIHHSCTHTRARKLFRRRPYVWQFNSERNVCYEMRSLILRTDDRTRTESLTKTKSAVTHASHESRIGDGCARFLSGIGSNWIGSGCNILFWPFKNRNNNNCLELRVYML